MAKKKIQVFECQHCGFQSSKWLGKCSNCGAWESFLELKEEQIEAFKSLATKSVKVTPITEVQREEFVRFSSGESELDIVLGGGIVLGGMYLVGGSPGVGKSTLLLKIASNLAKSGKEILYVSGEESASQIKLRAERLNALDKNLYLLNAIKLEEILVAIKSKDYSLVVIDSIQTLYSEGITSSPGSVSQVREVTFELMRLAKEYGICVFIIGHITKDGAIAGPRILEHMVDCVLYFEGDSSRELRFLRGFKNRFGNTSEIGIFEMQSNGLVGAKEASKIFFSKKTSSPGSALSVVMEGSRALVLEVQALVSDCAYGVPKRACTGFDSNRLNMILALLERKLEIPLNRYDVFINITGGIKILETAADLAIVAAILSSFRNRALSNSSVFIGEVSLVGDVRDVPNTEQRLKEAISLGITHAIVPKKIKQDLTIKCFCVQEVTKIIDWM
ncbi:DNA repair protein RadA [Helicobacter turcicus]|uniref:DNA repair protein RadA n=1 Tax=Helicobacter turcicus TaxID=2867412 RepID=A0ABS7JM39_9HELI|nr:DNA repair protein RadA [Helicobacter turcicus]MBX7490455.1 DNA repair protein RadA [Helicobacter turcicus]MBX7545315.1 DNA repair protein RadA [Helicobacter turcicus]